MLRTRGKGQSLVEFALILPVLLMLLLGIIEGGRIIWAYVTVQNAAKNAARYAITGRPTFCP
ncbi:MAG: TadE family protein, partial [Anaerolineae bacterium]|nr:TadE family protein [Anaerolineae bacterium]